MQLFPLTSLASLDAAPRSEGEAGRGTYFASTNAKQKALRVNPQVHSETRTPTPNATTGAATEISPFAAAPVDAFAESLDEAASTAWFLATLKDPSAKPIMPATGWPQ